MSIDDVANSARTYGALVPVAAAASPRQAWPRARSFTLSVPEAEPKGHRFGTCGFGTSTTLLAVQLLGGAAREQACMPAARAACHYEIALSLAAAHPDAPVLA